MLLPGMLIRLTLRNGRLIVREHLMLILTKKAASKKAYHADPEKWKAYSRKAFDAKPEEKKLLLRKHIMVIPGNGKHI